MTTPYHAPGTAPDWRAYAAAIRGRHLGQLAAARNASTWDSPGLGDDGPVLETGSTDAGTAEPTSPALPHRTALLILRLAASFGSEAALAARLAGPATLVLDQIPDGLLPEVARLLPSVLPPHLRLPRSAAERGQPGTVSLVADGVGLGTAMALARGNAMRDMQEALDYAAPILVLVPAGENTAERIGPGHAPAVPLHPLDGAILAAHLAALFPGSDPAALAQQMPSGPVLARLPLPELLLALRAGDPDAVLERLAALGSGETQGTDNGNLPGNRRAAGPDERLGTSESRPGSTAHTRTRDDGIPLAELAGVGEAKDVALGLVADLKAWSLGELPWDDVTRGMLLAGPPGCGKTELARAMARDPGIHLEAGSYAAWQSEGHLGKMLAAMRQSFAAAAAMAPSVLFIDELDAFGSRTGRRSSSNESYEDKVITGLLECLDGIDGREGVVVLAACNHPERIDPAITRAGRFDRLIHIPRPDATALAVILRQHLGDDLPGIDLAALGQLALGRSGADCAAAVRAARAKARGAKRPLAEKDLRTALAPDHRTLPPAVRHRAALHEAGHAIVTAALGLGTVKALRIGPNGGETLSEWHPTDLTAADAHRQCVAHLGGRAAELLMIGDASGGAGGDPEADLARATRLLLACEFSLGLGDHGHLSIGAPPDPRLLLSLPPATRARLQRRLERAMEDAQEILCQHHRLLEELARDLEAAGFIREDDLARRLAPLRRAAPAAGVLAS